MAGPRTKKNTGLMPIAALPPNAIRAIGSTQALTDPASVVKELIDNALDGGATTISVEISADTLNEIRVKDNGHGITPNDRAWICTRYCTSKIRNLDDLRDLGGRSLGFRGEALASLAEMSGSVTISTRIEGEGTAVELIFNRQGQVAKYALAANTHQHTANAIPEKSVHHFQWERPCESKNSSRIYPCVNRLP